MSLSNKQIEKVKKYLMSYYKTNTWEECIDKQKYGDCRKICKLIVNEFPKLFNKYALDIYFDFSECAQNLLSDDDAMRGNHYVLVKDGIYYDFARGANCIKNIYVMTQNNKNSDKYDIILTDKEKKLINIIVKREL